MKLTTKQLKRIIKEELNKIMNESEDDKVAFDRMQYFYYSRNDGWSGIVPWPEGSRQMSLGTKRRLTPEEADEAERLRAAGRLVDDEHVEGRLKRIGNKQQG